MRAPLALLILLIATASSAAPGKQPHKSSLVRPIDEAGIRALRDAARGRLIVINFWATWCTPCKAEFPALLKLRADYHAKGVELILISADDPDDAVSKVDPFLLKSRVDFPVYIKKTADIDHFIRSMNSEWNGSLPATFIYDKSGKLVRTFFDEKTYSEFESEVKKLL